MSLPLFTSIKPPADEAESSYLRDCIGSWRAAAFEPFAVNGPSEIEALRSLDLPIEFSPLSTDGKPRIGAILEAIRRSGASFAGIINSDCQMIERPALPAARTFIACWRVDEATRKPARYGFDAFLFDTSTLPYDDSSFSIGSPWWDIWFPYACRQNGARIVVPSAASLCHRAHPLNWSRARWAENGRRIWKIMGKKGDPSIADLYKLGLALPHEWRGSRPSLPEIVGNRLRGFIMPLFIHAGNPALPRGTVIGPGITESHRS